MNEHRKQMSATNLNMASALKNGSEDAFRHLFDMYGKRIFLFASGYFKDPMDAEEIVQEVFLKIWDARERLSDRKSFDSYIFTIAKNAILNTLRKAKSEHAYLTWAQLNPGRNILVEEEINFNELNNAYHKAIGKLSPKRKQVFLLSREQNLSYAEIADKMEVSIKTVENQITAALADIRKQLIASGFSGLFFFELFCKKN